MTSIHIVVLKDQGNSRRFLVNTARAKQEVDDFVLSVKMKKGQQYNIRPLE